MSRAGTVDSVLVIRARDEASKAVTAIESAIEGLLATQRKVAAGSTNTATGFQQIVGVLAELDRAYARTAGASEQGAAALERQAAAVASNRAALTALEQQQRGAARAADQLRVALVDALLNGADPGPLRAQIAEVTAEMARLGSEAKTLDRTIRQQDASYTKSESSLRAIADQTRIAAAVTTFARQEGDAYTRSLQEQAKAAQVLRDIERVTGQGRGSATDNGATFSALDAQAAATERAAQAERDRAQAAELTNNALRARGRLEGNGGSAPRAADTAFAQQLRDEEAAAQAAAAADKELADQTARLRAELNPIGAIQEKLNTQLAVAKRSFDAGKLSVVEYSQAQILLKNNAEKARAALSGSGSRAVGLFGLRSHELTNLSYQINDVVTQLASGTSLTQTLGQQGGQILQIFPRAGAAIVSALTNPAILGAAAVFGTIVIALDNAADKADRLRGFMSLLASTADGATYGAEQLNATAEALDRYGLSAEDAVAVVKTFVREGVAPERLEEFGRTAQDVADVLGIKVTDAAQQVAEAFTGGYDAVRKLDDATNFLTATQRDHIQSLFDEGKAAEARNEALRLFSERQEDAAAKSRGPWADATRQLGGAYSEFLNLLSETAPIKTASDAISGLARTAAQALREIRGAVTAADIQGDIQRVQTVIANLQRAAAANPAIADTVNADLADRRRYLADLQRQLAAVNGAEQKTNDTVAARGEITRKQSQDLAAQTDAVRQNKSAEEAATAARREATEYVEKNFRFADAATKQAYIAQKTEEARAAVLKRIADERKRAADQAERERKEAERERKRLASQTEFKNPVDGRISSGFGPRAAPKEGASTFHKGVDFAVPIGTTVRAPADGVVVETGYDPKLGKFVYIDHGKGVVSKFGHLSDNAVVKPGQTVAQGDAIAKSGNTGNSTGAHLHYTVTVNGKPVDPTRGLFPADGKARFQIDQADAMGDYDDAQEKLQDKRDKYLASVDTTTAALEEDTRQLREQENLTGRALLAKQREAAIEDAIRKARDDAKQQGVAEDDPGLALRLGRLREVTGAYFDAQHAKDAFEADRDAVEKPIADLTAQRDALREQATFLQDNGLTTEASALLPLLGQVNGQLQVAIDRAVTFYRSLKPGDNPLGLTAEQLDAIVRKLNIAKQSSVEWGTVLGVSVEKIHEAFANALTSGIDRFVQALVDGENAFNSIKEAFLSFAADFLRLIAQMILQQIALNIAQTISKALGFGAPIPVGANHTGGIAGTNSSGTRLLDSAIFSGATRLHTGGIAGLRPDEVPAILQKGEEVVTRGDPRHRANGGLAGGSGSPVNLKVINAIDAGDFVSKGLNTTVGEKAILNLFRANRRALKGALD